MTFTEDDLVDELHPVILGFSSKYHRGMKEDFYQLGMMSAIQAWRKYDNKPNSDRIKLATVSALNSIRDEMRSLRVRKTDPLPFGLKHPERRIGEEEINAIKALVDKKHEVVIDAILSIFRERHCRPKGIQTSVARRLDISKSTVSRRVKRIREAAIKALS